MMDVSEFGPIRIQFAFLTKFRAQSGMLKSNKEQIIMQKLTSIMTLFFFKKLRTLIN